MKTITLSDEDAAILKSILESKDISVPLPMGNIPGVGASLYRIRVAFETPPKKSPRSKGIVPQKE
jgi:hypothetical protein